MPTVSYLPERLRDEQLRADAVRGQREVQRPDAHHGGEVTDADLARASRTRPSARSRAGAARARGPPRSCRRRSERSRSSPSQRRITCSWTRRGSGAAARACSWRAAWRGGARSCGDSDGGVWCASSSRAQLTDPATGAQPAARSRASSLARRVRRRRAWPRAAPGRAQRPRAPAKPRERRGRPPARAAARARAARSRSRRRGSRARAPSRAIRSSGSVK